ncbi:hypothetical protein C1645_327502 [Glomus cerebriforme]|uniref:Zn(2)-C6 fungal-type domain-containing protein n=1 Tax=Glomus cerebriforme TaxID=658196 RepID=A0A397SRD4_9GLOM|nr:hypothetical protein C1645_327502 [Glomus cerebriforme]
MVQRKKKSVKKKPTINQKQSDQNNPSKDSNHQKIRSKVTTACTNCQNRKIKCSGIRPCNNCVKYNKHDECKFMSPNQRRGPKKKIGELITSGQKRFMNCLQNYTIDQQQQHSLQVSSNQYFNFFESLDFPNINNNFEDTMPISDIS